MGAVHGSQMGGSAPAGSIGTNGISSNTGAHTANGKFLLLYQRKNILPYSKRSSII